MKKSKPAFPARSVPLRWAVLRAVASPLASVSRSASSAGIFWSRTVRTPARLPPVSCEVMSVSWLKMCCTPEKSRWLVSAKLLSPATSA